MKLTKTPEDLPDDVVTVPGRTESDEVELGTKFVTADMRAAAPETIKRLAVQFPPGYRFDREEANAR